MMFMLFQQLCSMQHGTDQLTWYVTWSEPGVWDWTPCYVWDAEGFARSYNCVWLPNSVHEI